MPNVRYHSLDSLRGIASLQVLISHSMVALPLLAAWVYPSTQITDVSSVIIHSPLSFFWSDSAAVKVFFVLSGFVLSLPYYSNDKKNPSYPHFFIKRIIRLYLPCLVAILISLGCKAMLYKPLEVNMFGEWVQMMWTVPINVATLSNLFLLKSNIIYFDRALWTIPPEIKLSLILPFAVYFLKPLKITLIFFIVVAYVAVWHLFNKMGARDIWSDYPTLYYFTFFILGSVVCKYRGAITDWINKISNAAYYAIVAVMIIIYTFKFTMFWIPGTLFNFLDRINDYVSAIAAVMILCIAFSERAYHLFNHQWLLFLGKISFSLYLVHVVLITSFAHLLHTYFSPETIIGISFLCAFPVAVLFYHFIEVPSLNVANTCSKFITNKYFVKTTLNHT